MAFTLKNWDREGARVEADNEEATAVVEASDNRD